MNLTVGKEYNIENMFNIMGGWTTKFEINGKSVGGSVELGAKDSTILWQLDVLGGAKNKKILELGPLEGAHTKLLSDMGASEIIAVEGLPDCFLRCLIVKEAFNLNKAKFVFCDFNNYVENCEMKFDFVLARGVLYHQLNPAKLIHNLSKITNNVVVWSQIADDTHPTLQEGFCEYDGKTYKGKINNYCGVRIVLEGYCGGLKDTALWLYGDEMRRCFQDAGFTNLIEKEIPDNIHGKALLFVAKKDQQ